MDCLCGPVVCMSQAEMLQSFSEQLMSIQEQIEGLYDCQKR